MSETTIRIYTDSETFIDRPMTAAEKAQNVKDLADTNEQNLQREAKAKAKAAVLTRLGISADEAALLLS